MQPEDSNNAHSAGEFALPKLGRLRLVALPDEAALQRRRLPRRRNVAAVLVERRRSDRRRAKPGIDGLLRLVLADEWR